jgi:hypothetical protein
MKVLATASSLANPSFKLQKQSFNISPRKIAADETSKDQLQDAPTLALRACHGTKRRYQ